MQKIICVFSILLFTLVTGCFSHRINVEGSVLVIVISQWGVDQLGCTSSSLSSTPQFDRFCAESVRFTHAYTSSKLSVPAFASILTGNIPLDHMIHNNAASIFPEKIKTLPLILSQRGYETAFFGGGVPLLKKTAISDGFATFDDSVRTEHEFYRPADSVSRSFLKWLESRGSRRKIFAVMFWNDLQFPNLATSTSTGEARESTYLGQLQEIDEAFGNLQKDLKAMKIWDGLTVVVVGLQGNPDMDLEEGERFLQMTDDLLHIPLVIKPSHRQRDLNPGWKTDVPVDLADLGRTLREITGVQEANPSIQEARGFSSTLRGEDVAAQERVMIAENDLPRWRAWGDRLYAIRIGEIFFEPSDKPLLFNTYTDRFQLHNIFDPKSTPARQAQAEWDKVRQQYQLETPKHDFPVSLGEKLRVARVLFRPNESDVQTQENDLLDLQIRRPTDWQIVQWITQFYARQRRFQDLYNVLKQAKPANVEQDHELIVWREAATLGFRESEAEITTGCLRYHRLLKSQNWPLILDTAEKRISCSDEELNSWMAAYAHSKLGHKKDSVAFYRVAHSISERRQTLRQLAELSWVHETHWDFPLREPSGPSLVDWILLLPGHSDFNDFFESKP